LIAECWEFNYLHDIDFLISHFDEDTRHLVQVHVVHGFWKKEDKSRLMLQVSLLVLAACRRCPRGTIFTDRNYRSRPIGTRM
jgi:hypothetical protein